MGAGFSQLLPSLRTVTQSVTMGGQYYRVINNVSGEALKLANKNVSGIYSGAFKNAITGHSTMAKFQAVPGMTSAVQTVLPPDPTLILMAATLMMIEKKLDDIAQTGQQILSFLEMDKRAEQMGNLNLLNDMLRNYKYNWDNRQYKANYHMKAVDIWQAAERNIIFYQGQIETAMKALPALHFQQAVRETLDKLNRQFSDYRLALYLFSFSSFLEAMLLGNFDSDYLRQVADGLKERGKCYDELLEQGKKALKQYAASSIESSIQQGIGSLSKAVGKWIGEQPILRDGNVDEWLQEQGEGLSSAYEKQNAETASLLGGDKGTGCTLFADSIQSVESIQNHTGDVLLDGESLYLVSDLASVCTSCGFELRGLQVADTVLPPYPNLRPSRKKGQENQRKNGLNRRKTDKS